MLGVIMLNVIFSYCYAEYRYAECRGALKNDSRPKSGFMGEREPLCLSGKL
jgi:hypothetical protein